MTRLKPVALLLPIALGTFLLVASLLVTQFYVAPLRDSSAALEALAPQLDGLTERRSELHVALAMHPAPVEIRGAIDGQDPAAALVALQQRVQDAIATAGGEQLSSDASLIDDDVGLTKLAVAVRGSFDELEMRSFVSQIELSPPYLIFEAFNARMGRDRRQPLLEVTARIVGHYSSAP